ncbi:MAG: copper amine oxidase N-terminal domain-containing protein, partial [Peptococcia bacterium]
MKKTATLIMIMLLLISGTTVAMATNTVTVYVDGVRVNFPDQKAYINSDNRTLVPVRFISEALGADVEWNAAARQVNVKHKGQNITLTIGQRVAKVNTGQVTLDTTASITNDRTMGPLRFVSECLNAQVDWNGQARAVYITTGIEDITQFVGKPLGEDVLTHKDGRPIYDGILAPGEATPLYMYVTPEQLPIKVGTDTIFSIVPGEKYVSVKQSGSR